MTKVICNVYKDTGLWHKPPPGLGDYIRGCAYLFRAQSEGPFRNQFETTMNLDLSPASRHLVRTNAWLTHSPKHLADASEHFRADRDGAIEDRIAAFLASDAEELLVSTNKSWGALVDPVPDAFLRPMREVFMCVESAYSDLGISNNEPSTPYLVLHLRDEDRSTPGYGINLTAEQFSTRVDEYLDRGDSFLDHDRPSKVVCISNNCLLRERICRERGFIDSGTTVRNAGMTGRISDGEIRDMLLMRGASAILSMTAFPWDCGFSVWTSRLFNIPGRFVNLRYFSPDC